MIPYYYKSLLHIITYFLLPYYYVLLHIIIKPLLHHYYIIITSFLRLLSSVITCYYKVIITYCYIFVLLPFITSLIRIITYPLFLTITYSLLRHHYIIITSSLRHHYKWRNCVIMTSLLPVVTLVVSINTIERAELFHQHMPQPSRSRSTFSAAISAPTGMGVLETQQLTPLNPNRNPGHRSTKYWKV